MKNVIIVLLLVLVAGLGYTVLHKKTATSDPVLTQQQAEMAASNSWGAYVPGEGSSSTVTFRQENGKYIVTAIYGQADDSVSKIKKEGVANFQDGIWVLSDPTITQSCWPDRGHTDFSTQPCR